MKPPIEVFRSTVLVKFTNSEGQVQLLHLHVGDTLDVKVPMALCDESATFQYRVGLIEIVGVG